MTKPPIGLLLRSAGNKTSARFIFNFFEAKFLFTYYQTMQLLKDIIFLLSDEISPIVISVRSAGYLQMRSLSLAAVC